ncbi:hypothetical protein [Roseobacter sp. A03A-229]
MAQPTPAEVLFVTYGGGHAQMVIPVIQALRDRIKISVFGLPSALKHLNMAGIPTLTCNDVIDPKSDCDALKWGEQLAKEHHADHSGIPREQSVAYLGLSFSDLVTRLGFEAAEKKMKAMGRHAFHPVGVLDRVLDIVEPKVVIATNSPRAEAAAIEAANKRGLKTISMTDVFIAMKHHRNQAQDITYLNAFAMENLARIGIVDPTKSESHFTGNPAFDSLFEIPAQPDPRWLGKQFPDADERPMVLFADMVSWVNAGTNTSHRQSEEQVFDQLQTCAKAADAANVNLALRPHPSQDPGPHEQVASERSGCFIARQDALHDLLRNVDAVIARSSTVALETVILRQRLIQLEPERHPDMPLTALGTAWGVPHMDQLSAVIQNAVSDKAAAAEVLANIDRHFPRQHASEAIAALIMARLDEAVSA